MSESSPPEPLGMSKGALYTIGAVCAGFSVFMAYQASSGAMANANAGYIFGGVLAVGAIGCFTKGRLQGAALRAIGAAVFLACLAYLGSQLLEGPLDSGSQSDPSVLNALKALAVFGIPGVYLFVRGPAVFDLPGATSGSGILREEAPASEEPRQG